MPDSCTAAHWLRYSASSFSLWPAAMSARNAPLRWRILVQPCPLPLVLIARLYA
jgi:hypothetical protein